MMMKIGRVWVLGVLLACGESEETVKDRLIGSWATVLGPSSIMGYTFSDNNTFELDLMSATGSAYQLEAYTGDYELRESETAVADDNGDYLFLQPTEGTCAGTWRAGFDVDFVGESLRMTDESGIVVLEPLSTSEDADEITGGTLATYGCFTDTGFYPAPMRPLSGSRQTCQPGNVRACALAGQTCEAVQTCTADGAAYGPCLCAGGP